LSQKLVKKLVTPFEKNQLSLFETKASGRGVGGGGLARESRRIVFTKYFRLDKK
jgi:hypothetical protein